MGEGCRQDCPKRRVEGKALPTIWDVPDDLWERIEPVILELDPPKARGRKRADQRKMLEGIIFRMRSSCQWNHLPRELGDDSAIHLTFQRWVGCGVLEGIWAALVEGCEELGGVDWEWQSADCSMGKARFGGEPWTLGPGVRLPPVYPRVCGGTGDAVGILGIL